VASRAYTSYRSLLSPPCSWPSRRAAPAGSAPRNWHCFPSIAGPECAAESGVWGAVSRSEYCRSDYRQGSPLRYAGHGRAHSWSPSPTAGVG